MEDFLNESIGGLDRDVTVKDIKLKEVPMVDKISEKVEFTVEDDNGRMFTISDCWIEDYKGNKDIKGLWYSTGKNGISPMSALAQIMRYHEVEKLNDFIGMKLAVYPDKNNYLVLTTCDITEEDLKLTMVPDTAKPEKTKTDLFDK
ncbi:hypothetical protein LCGC14_1209440 [marine sediment metagenome]|uniref:Uncharacterized protein n=1 Tax=marine sediment metagenome TaxID=412755 RepID=A0A0F9LEH5_9ZZZZ